MPRQLSYSLLPLDHSASVASIHVMHWGEPKAPPCLFLHGWLDNYASFLPLSQQFFKRNCIAIELPGHGRSEHKQGPYHFIDWVDDLYQIISALYQHKFISEEYQQVTLVAHSLGACVASVFAATFPEKLEKLVMIEALGPLCAAEQEGIEQLRRCIMSRSRVGLRHKKAYPTMEAAVHAWQSVSGLDFEHAKRLVERNLIEDGECWYWSYDPALAHRSPLRMSVAQGQFFCQQINCPSLLIKAEQDSYISAEQLSQRSAWFKDLLVEELGQGHHVHMSEAESVSNKISQFLDE